MLEQFKDRVVLIEAGISQAFVEYSFKNRWIFKKPLLLSALVEQPINKTIYWAYSDIARRSEKPTRSCVWLWFPRHSLPQVSRLLSRVFVSLLKLLNRHSQSARRALDTHARMHALRVRGTSDVESYGKIGRDEEFLSEILWVTDNVPISSNFRRYESLATL